MRIIGGKFSGRLINAPANLPVRPTTDYAKSALFNILNNRIDFEEIKVLDLFAGIGGVSMEFISRGAKHVTCVDLNFKCCAFIKETAVKADDLKIIEGIGPKIAEILIAAGIATFAELAKTKATKVKEILEAAGSRYKMHDPTSWPKQADLAAKGKMDELKKLQDELNGGK